MIAVRIACLAVAFATLAACGINWSVERRAETAEQQLVSLNQSLIKILTTYDLEVADSELPIAEQVEANFQELYFALGYSREPDEPLETAVERALEQFNGIVERANSLQYSATLVNRANGESLRIPSFCDAHICSRGWSSIYIPAYLRKWPDNFNPLPEQNGVHFTEHQGERQGVNLTDYYLLEGWMDDSLFGIVRRSYTLDWHAGTFGDSAVRSYATGNTTYTNPDPADGATFTGAVVASETGPIEDLSSAIRGDATLTLSTQDGSLVVDVVLGNVTKTTTDAEYRDIVYGQVPIGHGTYRRRYADNDFLFGRFYGDDNADAAGIFEHHQAGGIVGAFGARRQDPPESE